MRSYDRWTPDEIKTCSELRAEGLGAAAIARKLHRPIGSIQGRLSRERVGLSPRSHQPALIHFLLEAPATKAEILSQGFNPTSLKNLVTRGHVVGRSYSGFSHSRTYEVTNEGKRNLNRLYSNPIRPSAC